MYTNSNNEHSSNLAVGEADKRLLLPCHTVHLQVKFMNNIVIYGLLWLSFGFVHSLLAISSVKDRLAPVLGSAYRLSYNVFAVLHIGLVFLIGRTLLSGSRFTFLSSWPMVAVLGMVTLCGCLLILLSLRQYDLGQFSGLSQWRAARSGTNQSNDGAVTLEPLNVTGLNGWVRHPLYSGAFLYIWGSAASSFGFWTAVFASAYLVIGAHYEERKLIKAYGDAYVNYRAQVPAFIPRRAIP